MFRWKGKFRDVRLWSCVGLGCGGVRLCVRIWCLGFSSLFRVKTLFGHVFQLPSLLGWEFRDHGILPCVSVLSLEFEIGLSNISLLLCSNGNLAFLS